MFTVDDIPQFTLIMRLFNISSVKISCQAASGAISTKSSNTTTTSNISQVPPIQLLMH